MPALDGGADSVAVGKKLLAFQKQNLCLNHPAAFELNKRNTWMPETSPGMTS